MLASLQRQLIYFPSKAPLDRLEVLASNISLEAWRDEDGEAIGWRPSEHLPTRKRIVVFHGNAGYALDRQDFVTGLQALRDGWEVFLFEYPGYGARKGKPSESAIKTAATQALKSLLKADSRPLFLLGESLGSGVASYLAANFPDEVAGLLLITPFSSLTDVAAHHYPFLPVRMLLSERYNSMESLSHYRGPVAFLLAGRDEVVSTELGQQLYNSYKGPRWLHIEPQAGHNTLPYQPGTTWWGQASTFLSSPHQQHPSR